MLNLAQIASGIGRVARQVATRPRLVFLYRRRRREIDTAVIDDCIRREGVSTLCNKRVIDFRIHVRIVIRPAAAADEREAEYDPVAG